MGYSAMRYLSTLIAATVLVVSGLLTGSTPALAARDCNPSQSADVSITQTLTNTTPGTGTWTFLKEVTAINGGPCHVPGATFTDILPSGATFVSVVTNPSSWICPAPVSGTLTCTSTASIGVPGTQTFDITFTMAPSTGNVTDTAYIIASGVRDPLLLNNCSIAGYVGSGGGTVATGNTQTGTESCAFLDPTSSSQVEQVTFAAGLFAGGVQIAERGSSCAAPGHIGIGRCTDFFYLGSSDFTKVFVMNLAAITAAGSSYSSVGLFWEGTGAFLPTTLSSCNGSQATNPCITDKSKFKNGGATFVRLTIQGTNIPDGGYGWQ